MNTIQFGDDEFKVIQKEHPEVWWKINVIRLEKIVKTQEQEILELKAKIQTLSA